MYEQPIEKSQYPAALSFLVGGGNKTVRSHHRDRLTRSGADLLTVLQALANWDFVDIADGSRPPDWFTRAKPADFYPPAALVASARAAKKRKSAPRSLS